MRLQGTRPQHLAQGTFTHKEGQSWRVPACACARGREICSCVPSSQRLTLHHSPRVLPSSHQLVPNLHLLRAADHSEGQMSLQQSQRQGLSTWANLWEISLAIRAPSPRHRIYCRNPSREALSLLSDPWCCGREQHTATAQQSS